MIKLRQVRHLAVRLGMTEQEVTGVTENIGDYVQELLLHDPARPDKPREVINIVGPLRTLQCRIYRRLLLPNLIPSIHSHGGVRGRHIKSGILPHAGAEFALATDISSFYPSIHHSRVYDLFAGPLECSPDVARLLTRLCTFDHHLALGLPTSPILADRLLESIDRRIGKACAHAGLAYTRFVDDISISGHYSLAPGSCGIAGLVVRILNQHGFIVKKEKHKYGRLQDGFTITSLRARRGRIDVSRQYMEEMDAQLLDAQRIAGGEMPIGLYYTYPQMRGRVEFAAWINHDRRRPLMRRLRSIDWRKVQKNAIALGLQSSKKQLRRRPSPLGAADNESSSNGVGDIETRGDVSTPCHSQSGRALA